MKKLALSILCAAVLSGCASIVSHQEAQLDEAGFRMVSADTPERQAQIKSLPARQFVRGMNGDFVTYTYADPEVCNCLYVGSDDAYRTYHGILRAKSMNAMRGGAGDNPNPNGGGGSAINTGGIMK